jgi:hypothetical protein
MKGALAGHQLTGLEDLLVGIQTFLDETRRSDLEHAFRRWIERIRWVLADDGDCFRE